MTPDQKVAKRAYDRRRYLLQRAERDAARPPDPISLLDVPTVAYLAGLTDGDGCIYVTHTNRLGTYYPAVCWAMTDLVTIEWVASRIGGTTVQHASREATDRRSESWSKSRFKIQHVTRVSGSRAQMLCRRMVPYLITKRAQAELVLEFPVDERRAPGRTLAPDVRALREDLGRRISGLNRS